MKRKPLLVVVGGPTASGKTALAIALARHFRTEIVSADSRQFYREMRIGNARPSPEELAAAPHHFIADRSLLQPLTAGTFAEEALPILDRLFRDSPVAIAVGGSGLYQRSLCEGLDEFPAVTPGAAARVQQLSESRGLSGLQAELQRLDPDYFQSVDQQNGRRLERALRVCYTSGQPYSSFLGKAPPRPFDCVYLQPAIDRAYLYDRINRRVDQMVADGLEGEVRKLQEYRHLPVLQTVGYQEWWPLLDGEYDRERAIELIKRNSRRYAKRQITWFRDYTPVMDAAAAIRRVEGA
ncbi:tRNA dimethylallyltransferase [Lewinella marina]|uniref:tRNA dimethylallyltransferase n=1 Tax=Neolewinella marina TaxID=438751 RepID=A0A2G0CIA7_9BACT|nr:tRNA (adenosine(37)-N6)-dimethylallyltransferase MiaA [Neolewinella marina]NJB85156.1 tRNA dimethylallyltransferase [Neolewinella marina]PHK99711.1 tRNA (adenosine(37)-N6)-dimethylallyltransferase MiaA [Neolewinella marina]